MFMCIHFKICTTNFHISNLQDNILAENDEDDDEEQQEDNRVGGNPVQVYFVMPFV
jgi:hypothetical protein